MKKRLISLLLAFSMALTLLPVGAVSAFAAESGELDLTSDAEVPLKEEGTYDLLPSENAQGHIVIDAPNSTVTLNLKGDISLAQSQYSFITVKQGTLILEGAEASVGFTETTSSNKPLITVSSGANAVLNNGQFNSASSYIVDNSGTVEINGNGRYTTSTSYVIRTQKNSVLTVNGGYFHSASNGVIYGSQSQKIEINDGTLISEGLKSPAINLNNDQQLYIHGGTIQNLVGGRALDTCRNTTIEEQNGKKILLEGGNGTYVTIAIVSGATFNFKSGTVKSQNSAAIRSGANATVNITGGTICDSLYGVKVQANPASVFIGKDVHFENNTNDICLRPNQVITLEDGFKGNLTVLAVTEKDELDTNLQLPRRITTDGSADSQKKLKLRSNNEGAVILFHDNGDGTGYQEFVERTGYFVDVVSGTASIDGGSTPLSPTTQVPKGTPVTLTAAKQEGMEFEQWTVSPAGAVTDLDFDPTASETSFRMPAQDITLTPQYRPATPVDPADGSGCTGGAIAAGVAIGGAAAFVGYEFVTDVILSDLLPAGASIPVTRAELARLVWDHAGNPEPVNAPAFADVDAADDADTAKAAQWCTEQGLLKTVDGRFLPGVWVPRWKVIQVWNKAFPKN